jgi:nucleoside-diphosphate-sugar epimerase
MDVFIAGATGYLGTRLAEQLHAAGLSVTGLCRPNSIQKLPSGVKAAPGNALDPSTFRDAVPEQAIFVHLVGAAHPAPWKKAQFHAIDLKSLQASLQAATERNVSRFVFVSVAHPAPIMHDYIEVRMECERLIRASGLRHAILRPWYVLGPGHRWPVILKPFYALAKRMEKHRRTAERLGLVTVKEMVGALREAVTTNVPGNLVLEVPGIREWGNQNQATTGNVRNRARCNGSEASSRTVA